MNEHLRNARFMEVAVHGKREFTAESGLGFMRFIQVVSILSAVTLFFMLLFVTGHRLRITFEVFATLFYLVSLGVTVWLIGTCKEHARQIIAALLAADGVFSVISAARNGATDPVSIALSLAPNVLLIVYFLTSRRAKAVLVRPFSDFGIERDRARRTRTMWNPRSRNFWLRLLVYFFVFCVVGHWMEAGFCMLVRLGIAPGEIAPDDSIQFRDMLNPFYIYGLAFCLCGLLLYPVKEWLLKKTGGNLAVSLVLSFAVNLLFVAATELVMGALVNRDYSVWDYRNQPFNLDGQVCLVYSLLFALVATFVAWLLYPALEHAFSYVKPDTFRVVFVVALMLFVVLVVTYSINFEVPELNDVLEESNIIRS